MNGLRRLRGHPEGAENCTEASVGGCWMSTDDVADVIAERNLWRRPSEGDQPDASQIGWRIRKNPIKFEIDGKQVRSR